MPRITSRDYADLALGGKLDSLLEEWRADKKTYDQIVILLADRGVTTSRETIRRWLTPERAAS